MVDDVFLQIDDDISIRANNVESESHEISTIVEELNMQGVMIEESDAELIASLSNSNLDNFSTPSCSRKSHSNDPGSGIRNISLLYINPSTPSEHTSSSQQNNKPATDEVTEFSDPEAVEIDENNTCLPEESETNKDSLLAASHDSSLHTEANKCSLPSQMVNNVPSPLSSASESVTDSTSSPVASQEMASNEDITDSTLPPVANQEKASNEDITSRRRRKIFFRNRWAATSVVGSYLRGGL